MEARFSKEDIGKSVLLILDKDKDETARLLGAEDPEIRGKISALEENYVVINVPSPHPFLHLSSLPKIPYGLIKSYVFT